MVKSMPPTVLVASGTSASCQASVMPKSLLYWTLITNEPLASVVVPVLEVVGVPLSRLLTELVESRIPLVFQKTGRGNTGGIDCWDLLIVFLRCYSYGGHVSLKGTVDGVMGAAV